LVVTDIDMPWMEGLDVVKALRAAQIDVPVVVVSGLVRPELPELVKALGNALFLRKPIVVAELRRAVATLAAVRR
jgi:CheY-like chemotaxis protein